MDLPTNFIDAAKAIKNTQSIIITAGAGMGTKGNPRPKPARGFLNLKDIH